MTSKRVLISVSRCVVCLAVGSYDAARGRQKYEKVKIFRQDIVQIPRAMNLRLDGSVESAQGHVVKLRVLRYRKLTFKTCKSGRRSFLPLRPLMLECNPEFWPYLSHNPTVQPSAMIHCLCRKLVLPHRHLEFGVD